MATIFLLGPIEWDPARGGAFDGTAMDLRRQAAETFRNNGHTVILMEDAPDAPGEDLVEKVDRLLWTSKLTEVVILWPPAAKMQTTYDELLLLRDRAAEALPTLWVLHHTSVAEIRRGVFRVLEREGRSRYLEAVEGWEYLPCPGRPWRTSRCSCVRWHRNFPSPNQAPGERPAVSLAGQGRGGKEVGRPLDRAIRSENL